MLMKKLFLLFSILFFTLCVSAYDKETKWIILTKDFPTYIPIEGIKLKSGMSASGDCEFKTENDSISHFSIDVSSGLLVGYGWDEYPKLKKWPKDFLGYRTMELKEPLYFVKAGEKDLSGIAVKVTGSEYQLERFDDIFSTYSPEMEKAANHNNGEAQFGMFNCLLAGNGIQTNVNKAFEYLQKSIDNGYFPAKKYKAEFYLIENRYGDMLKLFEGDSLTVDNAYYIGLSNLAVGDKQYALRCLRMAATAGNDYAKVYLFMATDSDKEKIDIAAQLPSFSQGQIYLADRLIRNNNTRGALELLKAQAFQHNGAITKKFIETVLAANDSLYFGDALYLYYTNIWDNPEDELKLLFQMKKSPLMNESLLLKTAEKFENKNEASYVRSIYDIGDTKGFRECTYRLAEFYRTNAEYHNDAKALKLYAKVADKKYNDAFFYLYRMYSEGKGTTVNKQLAESYLKEGSILGNAECKMVYKERKEAAEAERAAARARAQARQQALQDRAIAKRELAKLSGNKRYDEKNNILYIYGKGKPSVVYRFAINGDAIIDYRDIVLGVLKDSGLAKLAYDVGASIIVTITGGPYKATFVYQY